MSGRRSRARPKSIKIEDIYGIENFNFYQIEKYRQIGVTKNTESQKILVSRSVSPLRFDLSKIWSCRNFVKY